MSARPDTKAADASIGRLKQQVGGLCVAALARDPDACRRAAQRLMRAGITSRTLADLYIPEAARRIGEQWVIDEVSFANVTIAVSRLQALLRWLGPLWRSGHLGTPGGPLILLMVSAENDHTLGAMVVLGQLRRLGCSVRLLLQAQPDLLTPEVGSSRFDAVMISAARGDSTKTLLRLIAAIRRTGTGDAPIVIGGGILETEPELLRLTGADHAENDPERALALCRLTGNLQRQSEA